MLTQVTKALQQVDATSYPYVAVDAEWVSIGSPKLTSYLSKQFTFLDASLKAQLSVILWDESKPLPDRSLLTDHQLVIIPCDVKNTVLADVADLPKKLKVFMYYSPKDVEAMVGAEVWRNILTDEKRPISKKRNLTGQFEYRGTEYTLQDVIGAFNSSLDKAMISVGVDNPYKAMPKGYDKARMDIFMNEKPYEFLCYAFGDTAYLGQTIEARIKQVNEIVADALGKDVIEYTVENFPFSSGSLVAKTFEAWLIAKYPDLMRSVMHLTDSNDNKSWGKMRSLKAALNDADVEGLKAANAKLRGADYVHGLGMGCIKNYALLTQNTGLFGAVVMGGRCVNEAPHDNPYQNRLENVVDIDLSSCYGSALRDFDYPFGIPTLFERGADDKSMTLKRFLQKYRKELVPGLYTIYVKGTLSFEQDLVHSKYGLSTKSIIKTILSGDFEQDTEVEAWGREIEAAHLGGDFLLTKKQIENGILTEDVLKVIEATATNAELNEWLSLEVVCAVYYPRSLEKSVDEWSTMMLDPAIRGGKFAKGDKRNRAWCRLSLGEFIGKFIDYRKAVKKLKQTKGDRYDLLQNGVKLFVNTTYGDLASPYFPMGNTVIANNITAKARTGVWMLSKALLTVQSITDGGMFSYKRVAYLTGAKKPGFHVLANRERYEAHRSVRVKPLTDKDVWVWMLHRTKEDETTLDAICTKHINDFWANYGLSLPFNIECKYENTSKVAVYFGSSDYLLSEAVGEHGAVVKEVLKCRGAKQKEHPKQVWMRHLLDPRNNPVPYPMFHYSELLGVNEYLERPDNFYPQLPGDELDKTTWHRPYTNGETYATYADFNKMSTAKRQAVSRHKKAIEGIGDIEEVQDCEYYFHLAKKAVKGQYN